MPFMDSRLPAHLEVSGLVRAVHDQGGFAAILARGERDAGTILVICCQNAGNARIYERMPQVDGSRRWTLIREEISEKHQDFSDYWMRRKAQDGDLWIVELDIAHAERFIGIED